VKIATAADFNGTRWTTNAVIHQVPAGISYLLPVGAVMRLFKRHNGTHGIDVKTKPASLDLAASRTGDRVFLHVANMNFSGGTEAVFAVQGMSITGGRVLEISSEDPRQQISPLYPAVFAPREHLLDQAGSFRWRFPARSVSVVELDCRKLS
jgi:hypothetical protein